MTSLFSFSSPVDIDIRLEDEHKRKTVDVKTVGASKETYPVYYDGESVRGSVVIQPRHAKKLQHDGIKIELLGCRDLLYDRGNQDEFLALVEDLAPAGEVRDAVTIPFEFRGVE